MKKISGILLFVSFALCLSAAPDGKKKSSGEGKDFPSREEIIKKFDKDGDGKLRDAEGEKIRKKLPEKGRKLPPQILAKFDKDGDGELNDEEREAAKKAWEARKEEALEKFDADGDGKLNPEERQTAMKAFAKKNAVKKKESFQPKNSIKQKKKGGKKCDKGKQGKAEKGGKKKGKKKDS